MQQFWEECEDSIDGRYAALFADDVNLDFVQAILAVADYTSFYSLMVGAAKRELTRGKK
jgi:hypothetical protein